MQFSEKWLRSWVNPALDTAALADLLTMAGLEVEEYITAAPAFSGVVIAEIIAIAPHENADRLRIAQVNIGQGKTLQIVCGAPNAAVGKKVPCALNGALLPGDFKIKSTKMRGVLSEGMLCSGKELGIADPVDGLLILPDDAPVGEPVRDYLNLDDILFTLKITPNRADCLSIRGIAREVAALTDAPLQPFTVSTVAPTIADRKPVQIACKQQCGRYLGRIVRGINAAAPTPHWMRERLERSGVRSISIVVDVTNYVLLELGQPMHAFDLATLQGDIQVRLAAANEHLDCLNEKTVSLQPSTMVIADAVKAVAVAGVMGGAATAVTPASQDIFLESAYFAPEAIAGRSRELGFGSDSSFRYERGVDFALSHTAMERATALILEICGGQAGPVSEATGILPERKPITLRPERVTKVLGINIPSDEIERILTRLDLHWERRQSTYSVTPPSFRFDLTIEEDLIEEVARVHGYQAIPNQRPYGSIQMLPLPETKRSKDQLRHLMAHLDYQEIISYTFVDEGWEYDLANNYDPIRLINPIASQMSVMRSTLLGSLIEGLANNLRRKHDRVRLFEIGRVFRKTTTGFDQPERLAGLAWGGRVNEQWGLDKKTVDFFDIKADVEALLWPIPFTCRATIHPAFHPGRCAELVLDDKIVGVMGELHPKWLQKYDLPSAPILFELDYAVASQRDAVKAKPVSKFQAVRRDLALIVRDDVSVAAVQNGLYRHKNALVTDITVFDLYKGKGIVEGEKSIAFKITLQHAQRTLTEDEIEETMRQLLTGVMHECQARLRQ